MGNPDARDRAPPAKVVAPPLPGLNSLVTLVATVVAIAGLYLAREVLIPITLAVLLSFLLAPLVTLLRRLHIPNVASVLFAVALGLSAIGAIGGVIGLQVASLATDVPQYASTIDRKINTLRTQTLARLANITNMVARQVTAPAPVQDQDVEKSFQATKPIPVEVNQHPPGAFELARNILEPILAPFESALIMFIVAVFILLQKEDLRDRIIRLFGSGDLHRTTTAMDDAASRLSRYFVAQVGINSAFGAVVGIGLAVIGVPSPILWGILGALLRFVPYVGGVLAAALPMALAAAVSPGWSMVLWTAGLFAAAELVTGQGIEPMVYGHSTGLSPVAVVVAAIFWSWIWGPIGLVLSTPLTLCLAILGRYVDRLEFLEVLLSDRPALTPIENFYQRMLAEDPDEALQQAELLLKERSLSTYYDEVVLKGLQLAANDAKRGVLDDEKRERIKASVQAVIEDLSDHDDREPDPEDKEAAKAIASRAEREVPNPTTPLEDAPIKGVLAPRWRSPAPVLCLAGRGPLDDAAATILMQLLSKHGLGGRAASYETASRGSIASLDPGGVAMVCICYLGIRGNPAALHYLVRRVKRRLPQAPVLVGFWPIDDAALKDDRTRIAIGADFFSTSLREAVETCVRLAHENVDINGVETGSHDESRVSVDPS
ncbi:MAG: AI-2E family transporter [Acidobacteriaceae bacterium]|nr:AI-2E family transporter [Acidobacteriaceae bacterium]